MVLLQGEETISMLEKEVDYRLGKWLLAELVYQGAITEPELKKAWRKLAEQLEPPFLGVEDMDGRIGDGVIVDAR